LIMARMLIPFLLANKEKKYRCVFKTLINLIMKDYMFIPIS
jgi:hypothetical protein